MLTTVNQQVHSRLADSHPLVLADWLTQVMSTMCSRPGSADVGKGAAEIRRPCSPCLDGRHLP